MNEARKFSFYLAKPFESNVLVEAGDSWFRNNWSAKGTLTVKLFDSPQVAREICSNYSS